MADNDKKLTFFQKKPTKCPVCETSFYREDLLSGGGRLIAGNLTRELRRLYDPSKKFGETFPLIYYVTVCPSCFYAGFPSDFSALPDKSIAMIEAGRSVRVSTVQSLFGGVDFTEPRGLAAGAASYFLAMTCLDAFGKEVAPTIKQGICALRAAWICSDLHAKASNQNWDYLALEFYRKARFFYSQAVFKEQKGKESMVNAKNLGPDLDKNYGYDGVLYISGYLEQRFGPKKDNQVRMQSVAASKRVIAKIFGMGRASKNKPSVLLDLARELYAEMTSELERLGATDMGDDEEAVDEEA